MSALFSWVDRLEGATVSTDSELSTLPASNIKDRRVQKVWRTDGDTTAYFGVDFGSAVSVGVLGIFGATISSTDTVRHRLSAVALGNGELLDTTAVASTTDPNYLQQIYILSAEVNARYWRCDIVASSRSSEGYFEVGRAWAGPAWTPSINFSLGWSAGWVDTSAVEKSPRSGAVFVDEGVVFRRMGVTFDSLAESDRTQALELDRAAGRRGQILFVPDTSGDPETEAILGRMIDTSPVSQPTEAWPARYSKAYQIEQDL
jgi:hypothetical protein